MESAAGREQSLPRSRRCQPLARDQARRRDQELDVYTETIAGTNKSKGKRAYKKGGAVDLETLLEEIEEMEI